MKCNNCGNTVLEGSTVCPYCNADLSNIANAAPDITITSINETPAPVETPVPAEAPAPVEPVSSGNDLELPQMNSNIEVPNVGVSDETMIMNTVMAAPTVGTPEFNLESEVATSTPEPTVPELNTVVEPTVVNTEIAPTVVNTPEQSLADNFTSAIPTVSSPEIPVAETVTAPTKKKGGFVKILLIILAVVLVLGGVAYYFEFQTGSKRIEIIVNELFSGFKDYDITAKRSGTYNLTANVTGIPTGEVNAALSGKYSSDIKNNILDFTLNLNKLVIGTDLLGGETINIETALEDGTAYIKLENLLEKYIKYEDESIKEIFESLRDNDINTSTILNGIENALIDGIDAMPYAQKVGNVKIGDSEKLVNILTFNVTEKATGKFIEGFLSNVSKNDALIAEISKSTGVSQEDYKNEITDLLNSFKESINELDDTEAIGDFYVYTGLVGKVFEGFEFKVDDINILITAVTDGYNFTIIEGEEKFSITYTKTVKNTDEGTATSMKIVGETKISGANMAVSISLDTLEDKEPVINTINKANSITIEELLYNQEDLINLANSLSKYQVVFDNLGIDLDEIFGDLIVNTTPTEEDLCAAAVNCIPNGDGTSNCSIIVDAETTYAITCPTIG